MKFTLAGIFIVTGFILLIRFYLDVRKLPLRKQKPWFGGSLITLIFAVLLLLGLLML